MALKSIGFVVFAVMLVCWGARAEARSTFPDSVPNAYNLEERECLVCHTRVTGGIETLNGFGLAAQSTLTGPLDSPHWDELFAADSDFDGYSNGLELGDPDGTWTPGSPDPVWVPSNPCDTLSTLCGNGTLEGPETCEGELGDEVTCESLGETMNLAPPVCSNRCRVDPSPCFTEPMPDPEPDMAMNTGPDTTEDVGDPSDGDGDDGGCSCSLRKAAPQSSVLAGLLLCGLLACICRRSR